MCMGDGCLALIKLCYSRRLLFESTVYHTYSRRLLFESSVLLAAQ